ncbi:unnamed protein product [Acanthoscelides obtectus]|uniref:Uncharacterized protein n=1 Tax=Acanthoscelides obtectus TaxID=200917 RepID=A0A9P0NV03_ACAOB|nr:unnamed protein product [Acanthoscelides obtectus]CAK1655012.1 hypothetical protein AOBTE_LOCUS18960 [Acanthoscelides obtectus]
MLLKLLTSDCLLRLLRQFNEVIVQNLGAVPIDFMVNFNGMLCKTKIIDVTSNVTFVRQCQPNKTNSNEEFIMYTNSSSSVAYLFLVPITWQLRSNSKVMFELLLGTTVVNSWIVYNMVSGTKLRIMEFRTQLAKDLVIEQAEVPKQPVPEGGNTLS